MRKSVVVFTLLLGLLAACDSGNSVAPDSAPDLTQDMEFKSQYPEGPSVKLKFERFDKPVDVVINNDMAFLGDVAVGEIRGDKLVMADAQTLAYSADNLVTQGTGILKSSGQRWPGGVIPYVFDSGIPQSTRAKVRQAIADYDAKTAVRFVPRSNQRDYVRIVDDEGRCYSFIGKVGGGQKLSLGTNCSVNAARHELGHALGLQHEQVRRDRDRWVKVNAGGSNNAIDNGSGGNPIGDYDFQSMMHYRNRYRDGRWDYEPKTGFAPERVGNDEINTFTTGDLAAIASIYGGGDGGQEATACLFFDVNYGGNQICTRGTGVLSYIGNDWNDKASSVKVTPGYVLEMFYDSNLRGGGFSTGGNLADFRSINNINFNDKLSSLRIRKK